eukprot:TRINITY_DN13573_c1_g1_i1.p1 TRINITY_DN13573_c1_g1~~TRINITY_DN13573_c1_g1_i1.p1  ORF type:complete len:328 (-),score=49.24 TRINITY_DN13573_c1_g1_i1:117-1100(-)
MAPGFAVYVPHRLPPEKPELDLRWRRGRPDPDVAADQDERTRQAIARSCACQNVPGYAGYAPSVRAESIYQGTQANRGRLAERAQSTNRLRLEGTRSALPSGEDFASADTPLSRLNGSLSSVLTDLSPKSRADGSQLLQKDQAALDLDDLRRTVNMPRFQKNTMRHLPQENRDMPNAPDEHPLGKSMATIVRHHSVPTLPGYGGFVPAKYAENVHGSGVIGTCKKAATSISERIGPPQLQRTHAPSGHSDPDGALQLVSKVREHCGRPIPGYQGHVPRVEGESIFGARQTETHKIGADFFEDRICGTPGVQQRTCPPQVPRARKLRF